MAAHRVYKREKIVQTLVTVLESMNASTTGRKRSEKVDGTTIGALVSVYVVTGFLPNVTYAERHSLKNSRYMNSSIFGDLLAERGLGRIGPRRLP
jgi:hypothetical protein